MAEELVLMDNVSKYYGRVRALDGVTFRVFKNEIVGLLGDNGAGKSTLIKVLSGAVRATGGTISIKGRKVDIRSTADAIAVFETSILLATSDEVLAHRGAFWSEGRLKDPNPVATPELAAELWRRSEEWVAELG